MEPADNDVHYHLLQGGPLECVVTHTRFLRSRTFSFAAERLIDSMSIPVLSPFAGGYISLAALSGTS